MIGFLIFLGIVVVGCVGLFLAFVGENGYPHECIHCNTCPASIRCNDEKNMKCYEPGWKARKKEMNRQAWLTTIPILFKGLLLAGIFIIIIHIFG